MVISDSFDRIRLLFVSEKKPFLQLKSILGFYPHNIQLYRQALIHKSVAYYEREREKAKQKEMLPCNPSKAAKPTEANKHLPNHINNERLEYLGDAVLGAIVADILYKHYKTKQEGFLTKLRSKIVCRNSLNQLAVELGLDKLIQHTGAVTTGHNSFMNGNAFEAFCGAIYLDRGYHYCYRFVEEKVFKYHLDLEQIAKQEGNFKSAFIEWCQKYQYSFVFTQKETRDRQNHNTPIFHSRVIVEGILCGTGDGYTKKESDQNAAKQALHSVKHDKQLSAKITHGAEARRNKSERKGKTIKIQAQ